MVYSRVWQNSQVKNWLSYMLRVVIWTGRGISYMEVHRNLTQSRNEDFYLVQNNNKMGKNIRVFKVCMFHFVWVHFENFGVIWAHLIFNKIIDLSLTALTPLYENNK